MEHDSRALSAGAFVAHVSFSSLHSSARWELEEGSNNASESFVFPGAQMNRLQCVKCDKWHLVKAGIDPRRVVRDRKVRTATGWSSRLPDPKEQLTIP